MRCNNCGAEIPDGMTACQSCGNRIEYTQQGSTNQAQGPNGQPFGAPNYQNMGQHGGYQGQPYGYQGQPGFNNQIIPNAPEFVTYLIIGIVYTLCCCNFLIGIPGIILTILMNTSFKSRDLNGYASFRKITKWVYIIGVILWVVMFIFSMITGVFGAFIDVFRYY